MSQAEGTTDLFLGIAALVVTNQHNLMPSKTGKTAIDRRIVAEMAIAVYFPKFPANQVDIIAKQRALWVTRHLDGFPSA